MKDKLTDAIRVGKVSSIDPVNCTAQVTFEDRDDIVSGDLFIVVPFTLNDKAYYMPAVGERVRVLFDPDAPSKGCILGSYYAENRLPPFGDECKTYIRFEDGTLIEYDKRNHALTINVPGSGRTSVDIVTASDVSVKSGGNVKIVSAGDIELKAGGSLSAESAGAMTLKGETIDLN